jgi:hypothetical protein
VSGLEKLVVKAQRLISDRRITRIQPGTFQVIGDHGTYIVVKGVDDAYHCGCPGYLSKGFCSHALAVTLLSRKPTLKKRETEEYQNIPPEVPIERIQKRIGEAEPESTQELDSETTEEQ